MWGAAASAPQTEGASGIDRKTPLARTSKRQKTPQTMNRNN